MKAKKELAELRAKEAKTLFSELVKEKDQLAHARIAVQLGKHSKVHQLAVRRKRIARMMSILSEKMSGASRETKG